MDQKHIDEKTKIAIPRSVSFRVLGLIVLAFLVGFATYGLIANVISQQPLNFSTTALIAFVLSVLLAGSSIVLAITAIALGKSSEQAMIMRSDESIRLQNEVFLKTTDALQRIESSTGVTEKRIEDIISGRVGDLSETIAKLATGKKEIKGQLNVSELEEVIKQSLLQGLKEEGLASRRSRISEETAKAEATLEKLREEERKKESIYRKRHIKLLQAFSTRDELKAWKMGHGTIGEEGEDFFDGLFIRDDGQKIGVSTLSDLHEADSMSELAEHSLYEIRNRFVAISYIFLFNANDSLVNAYNRTVSVADPELVARLPLIVCPPDKISETVNGLDISIKELQATSTIAPYPAPKKPEANVGD